MITNDKRNEIKKVLGHRYAIEVADIAKLKGLLNSEGKIITPNYITQVLNGRFNNSDVLNIILVEFKRKKRTLVRETKKLNKL